MDVRDDDGNGLKALLSDPPKVLQVVAIAVLIMGLGAAVAYYAQYVVTSDRSGGWQIASMTFYLVNSAVYAPAVLLGFMALLLVRSDERRDQAIKITRLIMIAVVLLVLSGLGQVICLVGASLSANWVGGSPWWNVATQAISFMASVLFESGVLLGLVYIFRQQERRHGSQQLSKDERAATDQSGSHGIQ